MSGGTSWVDAFVARRDAARAFLAGIGMAPQRADRDSPVAAWRVPLWAGTFSDHELIDFAAERGFRMEGRAR
ncbi:MAG: hypothetical protein ACK4K7_03140 [Allosphingosinicella sp.]|uniref:hypothetical protein n=1 Tax=Allosphingosinicella sp. TaxID=2823234 RepID=UPI00393778C4